MIKRIILILSLFLAISSVAAPFSGFLDITNSKGKIVRIYGEGDEFDAIFETVDGYSVIPGKADSSYYYAKKDGDTLVSTGVEIGEETHEVPSSLEKHLRDTSEEHSAEVEDRVRKDEDENHTNENWENIKDNSDSDSTNEVVVTDSESNDRNWFMRLIDVIIEFFFGKGDDEKDQTTLIPLGTPPKTTTTGRIVGLTVLVDFPDAAHGSESKKVHPNVTVEDLNNMLNADHFNKFGCQYSVRENYLLLSNGRLELTNAVIGYVMMPHARSYYDKTDVDCGECAKLLIADMWSTMKKRTDWNTDILKTIQGVSYNAKTKKFLALSIFFAGNISTKWCYGLWAHKHTASSPVFTMADKKTKCSFSTYQISAITSCPYIDTFRHECGHMVCSFPDLYDYTNKSRGAGYYSMMASGDSIDPYLAEAAGWIDTKIMPDQGWIELPHDNRTVYKFVNPKDTKQYYLVQNKHRSGIDSTLPGSGIVIWRCNRSGNNTSGGSYKGKGSNLYRRNYELSIVQADGKYDLEQKHNNGDEYDFWKSDNTYATYSNEVSDTTVPDLTWRDNSASGLRLSRFSADGENMRCWVGSDTIMESVVAVVNGYEGKYDRKTHKISVSISYPKKGTTITYSKTKDGKYSSSNPTYRTVGEYETWFKCTAKGYVSTNGSARVVISK